MWKTKFKIIFGKKIFIFILLFLAILFLLSGLSKFNRSGVINLGEVFRLKLGQTVILKDHNFSLTLTSMIYVPGGDFPHAEVKYKTNHNGVIEEYSNWRRENSYYPLDVFLIGSDYQTYAEFVINKPEARCESATELKAYNQSKNDCLASLAIYSKSESACYSIPDAVSKGLSKDDCLFGLGNDLKKPELCAKISKIAIKDECYRGVAINSNNSEFCYSINTTTVRDDCFEWLARDTGNPTLCSNVTVPRQFCKYVKFITMYDVVSCEKIDDIFYQNECYIDNARYLKKGVEICNVLDNQYRQNCIKSLSDLKL